MAVDTEQLIVQLEAKISDFERNMAKARRSAETNFSTIENRAKRAAATLQSSMEKAAAGVANVFSGIGRNFLGAAGISGLGLSAALAAAVKLNGELARIPNLAREARLSTDRVQEIKFAANVKGISDEDFAASLRTSLGLLDEAQRQGNSLSRLFNANGVSIRDSNGELLKFDQLLEIAARLMAGTRTEQEKIKIAEMLGLSSQWIAVLREGPEAFRRAAAEANNAGAVIDKETVQRAKDFDEAWKKAITRFKAGMTEGLSDLSSAFGKFWNELADSAPGGNFLRSALERWAGGLRGMTLPELEGALQRSIEQGVGQFEIDRMQAEIDRRLGKTPLRIAVTPVLDDTPAGGDPSSTVIPKDKQENPFQSAVFEAHKRIAALDAETAAIGLNTEARERAKLVAHLEEAAKKANTEAGFQNATVTDAQREKINQLADAMEAAAKRQRQSHEALLRFAVEGQDFVKQFDSVAISAFSNFESGFASFITGAKSAKEAFSDFATSVLNDIARMVIRQTITAPLAGAIGGLFTPTHHTGYGPGDPIAGRFVHLPRFHSGIGPGERAAIIRRDESVLTPGQMRALAPAGRAGGGDVSVTINNAPPGTTGTATTSRDGTGNMRVDVWLQRQVDDTGAAMIDSGESALNRSIERRYGLNPRL
jgi:hypothetical protein